MKILVTKSNGKQIELSNVAGVEIVQPARVSIVAGERVFGFALRLEPDRHIGASIFDSEIPWPGPNTSIG